MPLPLGHLVVVVACYLVRVNVVCLLGYKFIVCCLNIVELGNFCMFTCSVVDLVQ